MARGVLGGRLCMSERTVPRSADWARIEALPRRRWTDADADAWAVELTREFRLPGAPASAKLRRWQGAALAEFFAIKGLWAALPVGLGKTLITFLACVGARCSVLVIPANLRDKTQADFRSFIGTWRAPSPWPRIVSREELALESNARLLEALNPDVLVVDEADDLANRKSAACRRIDRLVAARDDLRVLMCTGTPSRKSIMGYWHHLCWCLREGAPVPLRESEALTWAGALDETNGPPATQPGPMGRTRTEAREWYRRRLIETPGVLIVDGDSAGKVPISFRVRYAKEDPAIDKHYEAFLLENKNPAGIEVSDSLSRWKMDSFLGSGYWQYYDPQPPQAWRDARREFAALCRDAIDRSEGTARPIETELQVRRRFAEHEVVVRWEEFAGYTPPTRAEWFSATAIETAVAWLNEARTPAIVWCGGVEFAHALAVATRLPYFGPKGRDQNGNGLHAAKATGHIIVSWNANKKGFNLQDWERSALFQPPQSAKWLEQMTGRQHRSGRVRPLRMDVFATSGGTVDAFRSAIAEAGFARSTVSLTQKVLRAAITYDPKPTGRGSRYRWATRK
jgi:hypothetical protein